MRDLLNKDWPLVSVVVITYNRLHTLKTTVESFRANCGYENLELIVSDDGSPKKVRDEIFRLPFDKFVFATRNEGLGANTNKGIRAATGQYILQLQDDWECRGPSDFLHDGVMLMEDIPWIGFIHFCAVDHLRLYKTIHDNKGRKICVFENDQSKDSSAVYNYSDRPHLKRKDFHERIGYYKENAPMTVTELDFCNRFVSQNKISAAHIQGLSCFVHIGQSNSFNPSVRKARIKARLKDYSIAQPILKFYETFRRRSGRY